MRIGDDFLFHLLNFQGNCLLGRIIHRGGWLNDVVEIHQAQTRGLLDVVLPLATLEEDGYGKEGALQLILLVARLAIGGSERPEVFIAADEVGYSLQYPE